MAAYIKATAYCIIDNNGRILLTQDEGKTGWKLPGGAIKKNESLVEAAVREVKEETGLDVEITGLVSLQEYTNKRGEHRLRVYFAANLKGGSEQVNPGEVAKIVWLSKSEVLRLSEKDFYINQYYLAMQEYLAGHIYPIAIITNPKL